MDDDMARRTKGKDFFFEKKKQKTFVLYPNLTGPPL
jgi:hypothetical protein